MSNLTKSLIYLKNDCSVFDPLKDNFSSWIYLISQENLFISGINGSYNYWRPMDCTRCLFMLYHWHLVTKLIHYIDLWPRLETVRSFYYKMSFQSSKLNLMYFYITVKYNLFVYISKIHGFYQKRRNTLQTINRKVVLYLMALLTKHLYSSNSES